MKKLLFYLFVLCMLTASIVKTSPETRAVGHEDHCYCGGHADGIGDHVCTQTLTWQPWDGTTAMKDGGHYYLNDTDGDGIISLTATQSLEGIQVDLCLNGVELTSQLRVILLKGIKNGTTRLRICDCNAEADWGCISSTSTGIAPVLHSYTDNRGELTVELYSGNLIAKDQDATTDSDAGVLRLGNNTRATGNSRNYKGVFNMYGGNICGGATLKAGGNVYISVDCTFNLYGGTISGGNAGQYGGNVFVSGHLKLTGGQIAGGSAGSCGGGVYLDSNASFQSSLTVGGTVRVTGNSQGNAYLPEGKTIAVATMIAPGFVGVTTAQMDVPFATGANQTDAAFCVCDKPGYVTVYEEGSLLFTPYRHEHCVCGGAGDVQDHSCTALSWTSLSAALQDNGMTAETADFGKLPAGHYVLDTHITVTGNSDLKQDLSICLNGYSISRDTGKIFGYLKSGHTLSICDCSGEQVDGIWQFGGIVSGGTNSYGSVIYAHCGSTLNIYGGNFTGQGENGGVIIIANDGCGDLNGDGIVDNGDKALAEPARLNLYNGIIRGNENASSNSAVAPYHTVQIHWYGGQILGGCVKGIQECAVIMEDGVLVSAGYTDLNTALAKAKSGQYVRLIADCQGDGELSGGYVDLNGHQLRGFTVTGQLMPFDTTDGLGRLDCAVGADGVIAETVSVTLCGVTTQYRAFSCADGLAYSPLSVEITKLSIKPAQAGIGYKACYVAGSAAQVQSAGFELWLDGKSPIRYSRGNFVSGQELTLRLYDIVSADNPLWLNIEHSDWNVNARAFLLLEDGTTLYSKPVSYDLRQMMEAADRYYQTFTSGQQTNLVSFYTQYQQIMMNWKMPNIIHGDGTWKNVNSDQFHGLLTKEDTYYLMKSGKYILTEDIYLTDSGVSKTIRVKEKNSVTICLNGHTITSAARVFQVRGELNICDCCGGGKITSSLSGASDTYAPVAYVYNGTLNIYGGTMEATGQVTAGGLMVVGQGSGTPGTLNIFGGILTGGDTLNNGGAIAVYDKSTLNIYGGTVKDCYTAGRGGGVSIGANCNANLYGGTIQNCSGKNGGGVYITAGDETRVYLGSGLRLLSNAADTGGNVYQASSYPLTIDGAYITDGYAEFGGGVYIPSGKAILSGKPVIRDNENGSLYISVDTKLEANQLGKDADVHIYNLSPLALPAALSGSITPEQSDYRVAHMGSECMLLPQGLDYPTAVEGFQTGYGIVDISPLETGIPLAGYSNAASRLSTDTGLNEYDKLMATCTAITDETGKTVLLISADLIRSDDALMDTLISAVSTATGVPEDHIFITFTHTHSVPETRNPTELTARRYNAMLPDRFAKAALQAMADREPATMQTCSFDVQGMNFTRHYQYRENGTTYYFGDNFGSVPTGFLSKWTLKHVTDADNTMHLVQFTRPGTDILLANWRVHPHMTGGSAKTTVSADIIGTTRYYLSQLTDAHFMYIQGAAGNINETSRIDSEKHGYNYTQYGEVLAGKIHTALNGSGWVERPVGNLQVSHTDLTVYGDIPTEEEYNNAKSAKASLDTYIKNNPKATADEKRAYCETLGYLSSFHINNVISRYTQAATTQMPLNAFSIGDQVGFYTAPGELWDTVSVEMEAASPFPVTICVGYSQTHYNYFVYDPNNGGQMTYESYESNNYRFMAPDTINAMLAWWKESLNLMYSNAK